MGVGPKYCSQNGGNLYRAPYYTRNLNIGPRVNSNLGQSPYPKGSKGSNLQGRRMLLPRTEPQNVTGPQGVSALLFLT